MRIVGVVQAVHQYPILDRGGIRGILRLFGRVGDCLFGSDIGELVIVALPVAMRNHMVLFLKVGAQYMIGIQ